MSIIQKCFPSLTSLEVTISEVKVAYLPKGFVRNALGLSADTVLSEDKIVTSKLSRIEPFLDYWRRQLSLLSKLKRHWSLLFTLAYEITYLKSLKNVYPVLLVFWTVGSKIPHAVIDRNIKPTLVKLMSLQEKSWIKQWTSFMSLKLIFVLIKCIGYGRPIKFDI